MRSRSSSQFKVGSEARVYAQKKGVDLPILILVFIISLFGLLMVYDASVAVAYAEFGDPYYFIRQQTIWVLLGSIGLFVASRIDYHFWRKLAFPILAISVVLLLAVFLPGLGVSAGGAHRWLRVSQLTVQPAEVVKLASIVFFATIFQKKVRTKPFLIVVGIVSVVVGLLQRDLGSTIVYSLIAFGMYFIAGGAIRYFFLLGILGIFSLIGFILTSPYRIKRVLAFIDPFADTQGFTYHISQVLIALGSGGLLGVGIGQSRQKYSFIPEVTTDSIFSIIGEEFGFIGAAAVIVIFAVLINRGLRIADLAPDQFGRLLSFGLSIWLGSQVVVNLASMVSLIPLTGVPLPFISYGGSACFLNLVAIGILLNVSRQVSIK